MMNAFEYLRLVHQTNPKLFDAEKVVIKVSGLEKVIVDAFESGRKSGIQEGQKSKSVFEQIFG